MSVDGKYTEEITSRRACFRLKGGLFPLTLLEINYYNPDDFRQDLKNKVTEAPAFFQQTPVIICLENQEAAPLDEICRLCREFNIIPVGVREKSHGHPRGNTTLRQQAEDQGLALMQTNRGNKIEAYVDQSQRKDKIVTAHIRSGQQVYAPGGDLIVIAPVSTGAEILADGNIHVYGPLRGRALAGVQGDTSARVFCQSLEAELISVAGHFKLNEDLRGEHWKKPTHVYLEQKTLCIAPLHTKTPI